MNLARAGLAATASIMMCVLANSASAAEASDKLPEAVSAPWNGACKMEQETLRALIDIGQRLRASPVIDDGAMTRVDAATTDILRDIVKKCGWPTDQAAGQEAAKGAFLVLQHTPDEAWQREMLEALRPLAEASKMNKSDFAYLSDRVAIRAGEAQTWGTQFHCESGAAVFFPLTRANQLDDLRKRYGLGPFADYRAMAEGTCKGMGT